MDFSKKQRFMYFDTQFIFTSQHYLTEVVKKGKNYNKMLPFGLKF